MKKVPKKSREFFDQFTYGDKCKDCSGVNHPYALTDEIWKKVISKEPVRRNKGNLYLCLFCVEKRLKRPLRDQDFNSAPINYGIFGFHKNMWIKI